MRTRALGFLWILLAVFRAWAPGIWAGEKQSDVRDDVLVLVEAELARLSKMAQTETGPVYPRPSSEVAFLLLRGLAARGTEVKRPTAEELSQLGIAHKGRVQIFALAKDARIVFSAQAIQDRSGYWTSEHAVFYRRQGEKWIKRGSAATVTLPD